MNMLMKVLCYGALLLVWGLFAFLGKTPVEGFIAAIGAALASLATTHAIAARPTYADGSATLGTAGDALGLAAVMQAPSPMPTVAPAVPTTVAADK